jgi:hypothetical protein
MGSSFSNSWLVDSDDFCFYDDDMAQKKWLPSILHLKNKITLSKITRGT